MLTNMAQVLQTLTTQAAMTTNKITKDYLKLM